MSVINIRTDHEPRTLEEARDSLAESEYWCAEWEQTLVNAIIGRREYFREEGMDYKPLPAGEVIADLLKQSYQDVEKGQRDLKKFTEESSGQESVPQPPSDSQGGEA